MRTISQVAKLTGLSTRTLQYYDEIGLLKPSERTASGYRLYGEADLQRLQQIMFFKELDFKLRDIGQLLDQPDFDRIEAFKRQKTLLEIRRNRIDGLIKLLGRLEKGEDCMSFKEFDMSEYISALEDFKARKEEDVIKHWGSIEKFEQFIQKVREDQDKLAPIAVKQFGSVEKYTEAMKYNLEHFSELMERADQLKENMDEVLSHSDALYQELTRDMRQDAACARVQEAAGRIVAYAGETNLGLDMGEGFWDMVIDSYGNDEVIQFTEQKYGEGAAEYIARALRYYFHHD
ncbi:MerR family transcriptional regulator [Christensenellaceae bacterium NSJ-44]|uniref:MerR family transcriptional regulator n=1 Tax=Luoshenia tenuis TaxID=2763654 RepID=A0A926CYJ4_9FIRM|nr:MerR family transcriptional regulator [Luoshenia tenuis]MBC8529075.1 MerR family transcriptional regulator [Luoshenia tenuis]